MSNRFNKEQLEKALKGARKSFWINIVLVMINLTVLVVASRLGASVTIPTFAGGFCAIMAIIANKSEKAILIELGREHEL